MRDYVNIQGNAEELPSFGMDGAWIGIGKHKGSCASDFSEEALALIGAGLISLNEGCNALC